MHPSFTDASYSDDSDIGELNTELNLSLSNNSIPRTSHTFYQTGSQDDLSTIDETYQLSEYLTIFYSDFQKRNNDNQVQFIQLPQIDDSVKNISSEKEVSIEKLIVHLLDLSILSNKTKKKTFNHSWCNLSAVTSIEAKRIITSFFVKGYDELPWEKNISLEFSWSRSINPQLFSKPNQLINHSIRIFHYVGLGLPSPTANCLYLNDIIESKKDPTLTDLLPTLSPPCLLIFDCDHAEILKGTLLSIQSQKHIDQKAAFFVFFSCSSEESLRVTSEYPQNIFTCILLTPRKSFSMITNIEIEDNNQFLDFLSLFVDSIALDSLSTEMFHLLFRCNITVTQLWRRFILAQHLMKIIGLHVQSIPDFPDVSEHQLWCQFDYAMMCLSKGSFNPFEMFSGLYQNHFIDNPHPPLYVCAFVSSLMSYSNLRSQILSILANFMLKSPNNCCLIRKVLNYKYMGSIDQAIKLPLFNDWCTVMSGSLLIDSSLSASLFLRYSQFHDAANYSFDPTQPEDTRIFVLTLMVPLRDSKCNFNSNSERTTQRSSGLLFQSSPKLRLWLVIFLLSSLLTYPLEPLLTGPAGTHVQAMLLMYDSVYLTRALAVHMITALMSVKSPQFNINLMRCALKGCIDGSSSVRLAFLACVARYVILMEDELTETRRPNIDTILREDPPTFSNEPIEQPQLKSLIGFLTNDPNEKVRNLAKEILENPIESDFDDLYLPQANELIETAHSRLFAQDFLKNEMKERYFDQLFQSDEIELFETISIQQNSKITTIELYKPLKLLCCGTDQGKIVFGKNVWNIQKGVIKICHFPSHVIAVASNDGAIHLFKNGFESEIDSFLPGILHFSQIIKMTCDAKENIYVAQDQSEITIWNIPSLSFIKRLALETPIQDLIWIDSFLYIVLTTGQILKFNSATYTIDSKSDRFIGQKLVSLSSYKNLLCTSFGSNEIYLWELFNEPTKIYQTSETITSFATSETLSLLLIVLNSKKVVIKNIETRKEAVLKSTEKTYISCCIDSSKPLAALGCDDGTTEVWRIQIKF